MTSIERHRRGRPRRRLAGLVLAGLVACASLVAPASLAAADADFGTVSVGGLQMIEREVPLVTTLSGMDPTTVLYAGGDSGFDLVLSLEGLSAPLTAGALYGAIGEVTATYHLALSMTTGTHFSVSAPDCLTGVGACTATITFAPTATGTHVDTVGVSVSDLDVTGGGPYASMLDLLAPFLASSIEGSELIAVSGIGVPASGSVLAEVDIAASAACVELSTSAVSFGNLSLGDEDRPATPLVTLTNCSGSGETLYASGTDASGPNASWALTDAAVTCGDGLDLDTYRLRISAMSFEPELELSTLSKQVQGIEAGGSVSHELRIFTACPGSTGAGTTMTMSVNYLVVAE